MLDWKLFQNYQLIGSVIGLLLNSLTISLVVNKSPQQMRAYKNLIILTSLFEINYSVLELLVQPMFHSFGSAFAMVINVEKCYLDRNVLMVLVSFYNAFVGSLLAMFCIQFTYRYWAISGNIWLEKFNGFRILWWALVPVLCGAIWWFVTYFPCSPRPSADEYLRNEIMNVFNLDIDKNLYIAPYFYETNSDGITDIYYPSFIAIIVNILITIVSLITVFYFGFRCYISLQKICKQNVSQNTRGLQKQLFYSLIAQTLIPLFLMYIPGCAMFLLSFLTIDVGSFTGIVTVTIALFPAVDPLPTLIMVKCYRNSLRSYLRVFLSAVSKMFQTPDVPANVTELSKVTRL